MVIIKPIRNTFTPDYSLEYQEKIGICDFEVSDDGRVAYGHSRDEAIENYNKMVQS